MFGHLVSTLVCSQTLNVYRNWWWLLQKRAVCTKFDIYVFIAPVVISIKLLQKCARFFSNRRGVCGGGKVGGGTYGKIEYNGAICLWKTTRIHIFPQQII
jgi:hypothetical protein